MVWVLMDWMLLSGKSRRLSNGKGDGMGSQRYPVKGCWA